MEFQPSRTPQQASAWQWHVFLLAVNTFCTTHKPYQTSRRDIFGFLIHSILLPGHKHSTDVPLKSSMLPLSRSLPHGHCPLLYLDTGGWAIEEETNTEFLNPTRHHHTISNWAVHPEASRARELPTNTRLQSETYLQKARQLLCFYSFVKVWAHYPFLLSWLLLLQQGSSATLALR